MLAWRSEALRITVGFTAAVLINLLFLAALLLENVATKWVVPTGSVPPVQLMLQRLPLIVHPARKQTTEGARPAKVQRPLISLPAQPEGLSAPLSQSQVPPPIASPPSPVLASPTSPDAAEDDQRARAATALRHLGACSDFSFQAHAESRCGKSWGDGGADVNALTPAARALFSTQGDTEEARLQRSRAVRDALGDHSAEGNNLHYGCTLKHGKVQCSTY